MKLPKPRFDSDVSIEESLLMRRSFRDFTPEALGLGELSQLLWSAQGITAPHKGGRTAPSAGALYPLKLYVVVGSVKGLAPGLYRYEPKRHELVMLEEGDKREALSEVALGQDSVRRGGVDLVFTAIYERTTVKYGKRGRRYVHMEVGHAAQNVALQAAAMGLGAVTIGAFNDGRLAMLLRLRSDEKPLYIIPVGNR